MHDPTEGGLASALWELAEACGHTLIIDPSNVPIPPLAARVLEAFDLDPLAAISSGALLITAHPEDAPLIRHALHIEGIACSEIGKIAQGPIEVLMPTPSGLDLLTRPDRDEISKVFESLTIL
jgi:hydrogenase maturation factor